MSKTVVYWTNVIHDEFDSSFSNFISPPEKLSLYLKNILPPDRKQAFYLKCPSIVEELKKYYVVKFPIDLKIEWGENRVFSKDYNQPFFERLTQHGGNGVVFINTHLLLFCEESLELNMLPPFLHGEDLNRDATMLPAGMDIGRWIRPLHPYYIFKNNPGSLNIKAGEPLFYFKFNTDKEITFKKFKYTEKIKNIMKGNLMFSRTFFPMNRLKFYYDMFIQYKLRDAFLKEVKNNLVE